jgi:plastocyanin
MIRETWSARTLAVVVLVAGCVSERPEATGPVDASGEQVAIRSFSFQPPDPTVRVGEAVVWTNRDDVVHTVTADDRSFDSAILSSGEAFRLTPERAGEFPYTCTIHPFMRGTLRVTP